VESGERTRLRELEARIAELQAEARLLRHQATEGATYRQLLDQVDPHDDAQQRHTRHVAANLRRLREEADLTQRELGAILGHTTGERISYWERGEGAPSPRNLERLACVLEVHWTDFYARNADDDA
jgi:DNA-binding transcriptional regulator YiaG